MSRDRAPLLAAGLLRASWGVDLADLGSVVVEGLRHRSGFVRIWALELAPRSRDDASVADAVVSLVSAEWVGGTAAMVLPQLGKHGDSRISLVLNSTGDADLKLAILNGIDLSGVSVSRYRSVLQHVVREDKSSEVRRAARELLARD